MQPIVPTQSLVLDLTTGLFLGTSGESEADFF